MKPQQIKFRGFRTETNEPVYGDLIHLENSYAIRTVADITYFSFSNVYHVHPSSLGMFTGLTDKNGKEIYTGDLIRECNFGFDGSEYFEERVVVFNFSILTAPIHSEYTEIIGNQWEVNNGK